MPVEQRFGNAGGFGQLARRRTGEPFAGEERHRRVDNGLAALVAVEPGVSHGRESKRLLTTGQEGASRAKAPVTQKDGRPPPEGRPIRCAAWAPLPPSAAMLAARSEG